MYIYIHIYRCIIDIDVSMSRPRSSRCGSRSTLVRCRSGGYKLYLYSHVYIYRKGFRVNPSGRHIPYLLYAYIKLDRWVHRLDRYRFDICIHIYRCIVDIDLYYAAQQEVQVEEHYRALQEWQVYSIFIFTCIQLETR